MYARGVGPRLAEMLAAKGILTFEDLLYHLPFRYEDRQNPRSLDELKPGETASIIAEVRGASLLRTRRAPLFELTIGQGRHALKCIWFNATYLEGKFHAGQTIAVYGKVEPSRSTSNFKMIQPQWELLPDDSRRCRNPPARSRPHHARLRIARRQSPRLALAAQGHLLHARVHARLGRRMPAAGHACAPRPAQPRNRSARSPFSAGRHADDAAAVRFHACASPPHL